MRVWHILNETLLDRGIEVSRLGSYKETTEIPQSQRDQSFTFAFTPTAHSIGDWGILSSLPKYIKNYTLIVQLQSPILLYVIKFSNHFLIEENGHL